MRRILVVDGYAHLVSGITAVDRDIALVGMETGRWQAAVALPSEGPVADWLRDSGVEVHIIDTGGGLDRYAGSWRTHPLATLRALRTWRRELRRLACGYDLVHAIDPRGLVLAKVGASPRKPIVWHVQYSTTHKRGERWINKVLRRLPDACAVPSAAGAALIPGLDRLDVTVVPNLPVRRWSLAPAARPTVVTLARLFPSKGIETVIEAASLMRRRAADFRWLVVGGPQPGYQPYAARLAGRVRAAGLDGTVELLAHTTAPETLLRQAWLYVQPSYTEMFSISSLEAAANGLPVVASRVGGLTDIVVDGETGQLVEPGDPQQLADAVIGLLADETRRSRLGAAGRAHAARHFGRAVFADSLAQVYDRACGR
jgi:glycosyltransferase involved in cell wall biosynthesis